MNTPLIFDIKRGSTSDGPGIRTVVFFKGCNLDCKWCHNPEGKSPQAQLAIFREKCIGCGSCDEICHGDSQGCTACGKCVEVCPADARKLYGKPYTAQELAQLICRDKAYFDATDGGVTFSGGECMLYPEFLARVAALCRREGISVAIDTAGCVPYSAFESVIKYCDLFLYDIKCLDPQMHIKGTGKDNRLILENLGRLQDAGKRLTIRVPVIPGFQDEQELERIREFSRERSLPVEFLPYHAFGEDKKKALIW
jgi:pyruvate formate lyase activating enzyme